MVSCDREGQGRTRGNQAIQQLHSMYMKGSDWELYDGKNPADRIGPKQESHGSNALDI